MELEALLEQPACDIEDYSPKITPQNVTNTQDDMLSSFSPAEGNIVQQTCQGPVSDYWAYLDDERSIAEPAGASPFASLSVGHVAMPTAAAPESVCSAYGTVEPISAAAHLHLLGESLSFIGPQLQETSKMVCMSSCLSLLLDSMLCALGPLLSLTAQIPELQGCPQHPVVTTMENIAYVMPGL